MLVVNIALDPAMQFVFNEYGIQNDVENAIRSGHTTDLELAKPDPGIPEDELTEDDMPVRVKSLAKLFRQSAPLGIAAVTGHEFAHALYWLNLDENSKEGKSGLRLSMPWLMRCFMAYTASATCSSSLSKKHGRARNM